MNKEWHDGHRLDPKANLDQRIAWHVEHATACGCRDMPESIKRELAARNLPLPERRH
ncbi:hypothetical protein [Devosia equisanguinis]|uniref:hypothetical protein n=1 Tax=Devosia equisanguinis TaxID=2490941 RepID=UPI0013E053AC|nr:hypothetical protein [Devosia equisanguinis]